MSLKQQGNQYFRQGLYPEAIKCYQQYIEYDPQADKKVAYTNISFCQYKLSQFRQSIESANDAIAEDCTYKKAYYRKIMAYKELPHNQYEVFINIHLLLKYSDTMDEKEKYDYRKQMQEWKEKWIHGKRKESERKGIEQLVWQSFEEKSEEKPEEKSVEEWLEGWNKSQKDILQQWQQIQIIAKKDLQYAINIAYLMLNQLKTSSTQYFTLKDKIKALQQSANKMDIEQENSSKQNIEVPVKQSKKSSSEDDNLFDLSDTPQPPIQTKIEPIKTQNNEPVIKQKIETQAPQKVWQTQEPKKEQVKSQNIEQPCLSQQVQKIQPQNQDFDTIYKAYVKSLSSQSRDQMADLLTLIQKILQSSHSQQIKYRLLSTIKQNYSKLLNLMKKSFSKSEQKKTYELLLSNDLKQFIPDFASKHAQ